MKVFTHIFPTTLLLLTLIACQSPDSTDDALMAKAQELAHRFILADGHVDLPYRLKVENFRLEKEYLDMALNDKGDFDYARAKEGGLDAPFMSIYIPSDNQKTPGRSRILADSLIDMVVGITQQYPDKFALANSPAEVEANFQKGLISLPMGMENGAPVEDDTASVQYFYDRGIRYITLTHGTDNKICDSSYDTTHTWNGLSPFGEAIVRNMNRVGIMVDISHVSDSAFYDVLAITQAPVIASHSSCRYYTPAFERNMNDDMIRRLAENGGVIMINFGSTFLEEELRLEYDKMSEHLTQWAAANNLTRKDSAYKVYAKAYREKSKKQYSNVSVVADHIEHVVKLVGVDYVGLGSDFDGVGDSLPLGLKDVSDYPNLIAELLRRGFSEEDIRKVCFDNLARVWNEVERVAKH
ncbi:MAG: dipeptidase [Bacteroidia bacterium]|nr:dipeptidase [Bacteroidia bacterium]